MAETQRYVAFLRAINVGKRRLSMERLRKELESLGLTDVVTYIASGNARFSSSLPAGKAETLIEGHLEAVLGFEVATFVRTAAEVVEVAGLEPFDVAPGDSHYVGFLRKRPPAPVVKATEALSNDTDLLVFVGRDLHTRVHGNSMDSTISPATLAKALGKQPITSRNVTMLRKLAARLEP